MYIKICNHRHCIFGFNEDSSNKEIIKEALGCLSLDQGTQYFVGSSRQFFVIHAGEVTVHSYRENWNGWHDNYKLTLEGEDMPYQVSEVDYSLGRHRQAFI